MSIIPAPVLLESRDGEHTLVDQVRIACEGKGTDAVGQYLAIFLEDMYELQADVEVAEPSGLSCDGDILLTRVTEPLDSLANLAVPSEAYELEVTEVAIIIRAMENHGLFNGVQTLIQLLPAAATLEAISLQCVKVTDSPRFGWRGVLLDVGRHYFSVPFHKKFLDAMAFHKMNKFHWHLTEDQGWRLEVKGYPKLTEHGAWRGREGSSYGGFYSQDEVKEILAYAAQRFIEVVPEIELPGHCGAALASYPYLGCRGDVTEVPVHWGVHEDVYCAGKESTFEFLEGVLKEVISLFPSQYIHIGGDECPKTRWRSCPACQQRIQEQELEDEYELQSWFIRRINRFMAAQGKQLIGWDEILEGGLAEGACVMSWRGIIGGVRAARGGHDVIMSPTSHCYFDYKQSMRSDEPGAWYAMLPLEVVYAFDPVPPEPQHEEPATPMSRSGDGDSDGSGMDVESASNGMGDGGGVSVTPAYADWTLPTKDAHHIIGGQANVWTEYISDEDTVEYMTFPRLAALSEAVWSSKANKDWANFKERLPRFMKHIEAMGNKSRPLS
ncbi:hypothetical protein WJX82_009126 [Trebouxia sp. C0006]